MEVRLFWTVLAVLATVCRSAENERCPNTPQCICKWSGGKRMADCSNAGSLKVSAHYSYKDTLYTPPSFVCTKQLKCNGMSRRLILRAT